MTKVLVVENSPIMSKVLTDVLSSDPQLVVVGVADNGKDAVEKAAKLKPDIITMDIHMPIMDGAEATKQIMAYTPTPILVVSASSIKNRMNKVFKAISYGALDVFEKSEMEFIGDKRFGERLINKVKFLSNIKVIRHPLAKLEKKAEVKEKVIEAVQKKGGEKILAMIASTGGPPALLTILKTLPKDFPYGIVIVQHITSGFVEGMVSWLDAECKITVKCAEELEEIEPGIAYVAPCDLHMRISSKGEVGLSNEPPFGGHRPSGNILLESVAKAYKKGAVGVVLTGMGSDGAMGMAAIKKAEGKTIAQNEDSCTVFGMPKAAIDLGIIDEILPVERIAGKALELLGINYSEKEKNEGEK